MADRNLNFNLTAKDQSVSSTFSSASDAGEKFSAKIGGAISGLGDKIGGEVGELVSQVGEGFEKIAEGGTSSLSKLAIGGGVVAGLGVALQTFASKGEAAENQLKASIIASGESWDDYEEKISKADSSEAKYAHDAADTNTALRELDTATGSMDTALGDLNVTTDLAASKHESLADAAQQIALIYAGNTKILKQYGLDLKVTAGDTDEAQTAITALGGKLSGQASAAADTFSGKVAGVKTEVQDWSEKLAGFVGGPLTMLGTVTGAVTGVMEIGATAIQLVKTRHAEAAIATLADSAAQDQIAASAALAGVAEDDLAISSAAAAAAEEDLAVAGVASSFALGPVGIAIGGIALVAGIGATAMHIFGGSQADAVKPIQSVTAALAQEDGAFDAVTQKAVISAAQSKNLYQVTDQLKLSQASLTEGLNGNSKAYQDNVTQLQAIIKAGTSYVSIGGGRGGGGTAPMLDADARAAQSALNKYESLNKGIQASVKANNDATAAAKASAAATADQEAAANRLSSAQAGTEIQYGATTGALQRGAVTAAKAAQAAKDQTAAYQEENDTAGQLTQALNILNNANLTVDSAQTSLASSTLSLDTQLKSTKNTTDLNTASGVANRQSIEQSVGSLQSYETAVAKNTGSTKDATNAYNAQAGVLLGNIANVDGANSATYKYAQQLLGINKIKLQPNHIEVNTTDAENKLAIFRQELATIGRTSTQAYISVSEVQSGRKNAGNAAGGTIGGQTFDEYGLEALNLPNGTTVIPHGQTQQMMRGAGGGTTQINITYQSWTGPTAEDGKRLVDTINMALGQHGATALRAPWLGQ